MDIELYNNLFEEIKELEQYSYNYRLLTATFILYKFLYVSGSLINMEVDERIATIVDSSNFVANFLPVLLSRAQYGYGEKNFSLLELLYSDLFMVDEVLEFQDEYMSLLDEYDSLLDAYDQISLLSENIENANFLKNRINNNIKLLTKENKEYLQKNKR